MKVQKKKENAGYQLKTQKRGKKYKKKKRTGIKYFILTVLFLSALTAFALSPVFNIKSIVVKGNKHIKSDEMEAASGVIIGENGFKSIGNSFSKILMLRYGKSENKILNSQPYIKKVSVRFSIPDKVIIKATERTPSYVVPYMGSFLLMDDEGYILDMVDSNKKGPLSTVTGMKFANYKKGQVLKVENSSSIGYIKKLTDAIKESDNNNELKLLELLSSIDVSDASNISAVFDSRITVNFNDLRDLDYRLNFFRSIYLTQIKKSDKGFLDFNEDGNYYFRPKK